MSLKNVSLPSGILGHLVKEVVVLQESVAEPSPAFPEQTKVSTDHSYNYLGQYQKKICILVNYSDQKYIAEPSLELLGKMLSACQLNLADVAILNHAHENVHYEKLRQQLHPEIVILFGITSDQIALPLQFSLYRSQSFNEVQYLQAPAIDTMLTDTIESKQQKSALWAALKQLFKI